MHKICFKISFISCLYMFRAHVLIIRRSKLHYTASGIITPIGVMILWAVWNKTYCETNLCIKLVKYWDKCNCTLALSTLLVEHIIRSIRINRMTTKSRWKFTICTTTNDLKLYIFSSLYIFVTWGWPTVAETCRQPNKTDTKTVVFCRTYTLLICIKPNGDDVSKNVYRP
jgi:hypothetical protein